MKPIRLAAIAASLIASAAPSAAIAQAPPNYDFEWVTVGAPGNRPTRPDETPFWGHRPLAAVDYTFRIAKTEVTVGQWLEFVEAYAPHHTGSPDDPRFIGWWVRPTGTPHEYTTVPGTDQWATQASFHYAARYVNWLHNGKRPEREAFERGVYDTSTFRLDPKTGRALDQEKRSPGATFFLPTLHEWTKAAYYDPDRNGPGEEGYWVFPDGGDEVLTPGFPWEPGAETSGGLTRQWEETVDVGMYPQSASPWGMLDASGGEREWTETVIDDSFSRSRYLKGSTYNDIQLTYLFDRLDFTLTGLRNALEGIRVASVVPAPAPLLPLAAGMAAIFIRRQRNDRMLEVLPRCRLGACHECRCGP